MANLYFEATLDADQLKRELRDLNTRLANFTKTTQQQGAEMEGTFKRLGQAATAYFTLASAKGFIDQVIQIRGEFQQLDIALTTMLRNKATSDKVMAEIVQLAAKTPFTLTELGQGAKQLIAFKTPADQVATTLRRIGDIAAGVSVPVGDLVSAYGKVSAKGKMQAEELNQFAERGVPIISELAKVIGTTDDKIYKMAEDGKIGFAELQQAIVNMSSEGGQFFNLMEKQAGSLTGLMSNMGDAWDRMRNDIGQNNEGVLADGIKGITSLIDNYKEVLKVLGVIVSTYGAYRAAIVMVNMAQKAEAVIGAVQAWLSLAKGIKTAKDAQIAFSLATTANPWGIAAAGVAALVSAFILFKKEAKDTNEEMSESTKKFADESNAVESLFKQLEKTNAGSKERSQLITEINSKYGTHLQNISDEKKFLEQIDTVRGEIIKKMKEEMILAGQKERITKALVGQGAMQGLAEMTQATIDKRTMEGASAQELQMLNERLESQKKAVENYNSEIDKIMSESKEQLDALSPEAGNGGEGTTFNETEFRKQLSEQKKAYEEYGETLKAAKPEDVDAVETYYSALIAKGDNYQQYLENQLKAYKGNIQATVAIYNAAASANVDLNGNMGNGIKAKDASVTSKESIFPNSKQLADVTNLMKQWQLAALEAKAAIDAEAIQNKSQSKIDFFGKVYDVGSLMQEAGDKLTRSVGEMVTAFSNLAGVLSDVNATGFQKATTIVSLAITAGKELSNAMHDSLTAEADKQAEINEQLAARITIEQEILRLKHEQAEADLNQSAFIDPTSMDQYQLQVDKMKDANNALNNSVGALFGNAVFTAHGSAKRKLFGTKEGDYSFTMADILGKNAPQLLGGEGIDDALFGTGFIDVFNNTKGDLFKTFAQVTDPLGLFTGKADAKAANNALGKLGQAFDDTLKAMGKTSADVASMSASEWVDFYSLMEKGGYVTDEGTKKLIANVKASAEEYKAAMEEMKKIISDVAGNLGDSLSESLVTAFENGTDAAEAFKGSVNDILNSLFMSELQSRFFKGYFDSLQADMDASMKQGGDGEWSDDLQKFFTNITPAIGTASDMMKKYDEQMEAIGYKGFNNEKTTSSNGSLTGAVKGVSEETASVISGQMNAIRINQAESVKMMNQQVAYMGEIAANTRYLQSIDTRLSRMETVSDPLRAKGL
jgi:tape measure domain-containing protein